LAGTDTPRKRSAPQFVYHLAAIATVAALVALILWSLPTRTKSRSTALPSGTAREARAMQAQQPEEHAPPVAPAPQPAGDAPPAALAAAPAQTIQRPAWDQPARAIDGFDPNKEFASEGPMRVITPEAFSAQAQASNVPSKEEAAGMRNDVVERLQAELKDATSRGDSAEIARIKTRIARLQRPPPAVDAGAEAPR
jgi:hypothetical protein